jgi:hypothetical protein
MWQTASTEADRDVVGRSAEAVRVGATGQGRGLDHEKLTDRY